MTVLIKRYANRKLYNTETSRYITLKGIAELMDAGQEVRVIDNETGDDITSVALSQILVDSERANSEVPRGVLSNILQRGGGALRRGVDDASDGLGEVRRSVRRLVRSREDDGGRLSDWIASATPDFEHVVQSAVERVLKTLDLPRRTDIEALNANLERVAEVVDRLERGRRSAPSDPPASAPPAGPSEERDAGDD